ncbi:anti-sigma factor antagonist [Streptomyces sp. NPDC048172]|uniref:anti-sigma factor antagonist n=1 Tax=Streptomyces sp. NPDC048172 TaxID=3365505 RepID=UPI00371599B1
MEYETLELNPYVSTFRFSGFLVVELHGELDIAAEIIVSPYVDRLTAIPAPRIVLDLTPAEFLDCSGVRLIARAHRRVTAQGGVTRLVCPHPRMLWLLRQTRFAEVLPPAPTLALALANGHANGHGRS